MALSIETAQPGPDRDRYLNLVRNFPLRPLRSDEQLADAIRMVDSLIIRGDLDSGEQDYLDILTDIVERYESEEHPMPPVSDADMLRHLIEARGISQSKLAADVKISMSTVSEVLNGKRRLNRNHIGALSKYLGVPSSVFQTRGPARCCKHHRRSRSSESACDPPRPGRTPGSSERDCGACDGPVKICLSAP